jgi:hypothetical protein
MATYNLRHFSHAEALKQIAREHLIALLAPHAEFFSGRGVTIPSPASGETLDYDKLVEVLMTPDAHTPNDLAEALFFIDEMATVEGMDGLLEEARVSKLRLDDIPNPSPADIAVQVWIQDKDILQQKHAEQFLIKPRSFEYFQTKATPVPEFFVPNAKTLRALEHALDDWFAEHKRGRGSRVFAYPKDDGCWFLVRHGDPFKREGSLDEGEPASVFYRPEKFDVLVYDPKVGEIRMNARSKGEKDLYRKAFGRHLFGSEDFFPGTAKYTLEPLRVDGAKSLVCADVDGIEWVRLVETQYAWGGKYHETEARQADDIFAALEERGKSMPEKARIIRARFKVKFADAKTPRTVTIRPSNIAQYQRDADSVFVEQWLLNRGFIKNGKQDAHAETSAVLADA